MRAGEGVVEAKLACVNSLKVEIADLSALLADGYVDKQRIRQLDRSLAETLGDIASLQAEIATAMVAADEARLKILQLNKRFITQVVDELTTRQDELFDLQQQYGAINDKVRRATVRAPCLVT